MRVAWCFFSLTLAIWFCDGNLCHGKDFTTDQIDFFERRVRPLLAKQCYECHGPSLQESGLRIDSRTSLLTGGDRGPALIPGHADKSLLIQAISFGANDLAMPPDGKLSAKEIEDLRHWIEAGAAWPSEEVQTDGVPQPNRETRHWAFQPIEKPKLPRVKDLQWVQNEIDLFVLSRLEEQGITPSPAANHDTLSRRIHLDLIGLPASRIATEKESIAELTDRLLANPRYGERWGRHWLDVARYGDTRGYVDGGQVQFAFAYTYRDYVIQAFNDDLPFRDFILDQLAADQQTYADTDRWRLAAMGFLTVGRRFNHNYHDTLDDQIDVISRGLQGVTVSCARCHDHKYDPIPTADYYSLYGILASSYEPQHPDLPTLTADGKSQESAEHLTELRKRATAYDTKYRDLHREIQHEMRGFATDYLVYLVQESPRHRIGDQNPLKTARTVLRGPTAYGFGSIQRWRRYLDKTDTADSIFGIWHAMDVIDQDNFSTELSRQLHRKDINQIIAKQLIEDHPGSMVELAKSYGSALEAFYQRNRQAAEANSAPPTDSEQAEMWAAIFGGDRPITITRLESIDCYHLDEHTAMRNLAGKVEELSINNSQAQPRAMLLRQRAQPHQPTVFLRGQANRIGPEVPRQIPAIFWGSDGNQLDRRTLGDDRLALADRITDRLNPLTARVFVNRVWHWHFGQPLVRTMSDFGVRSVPPTHPKLLDYLAAWFMENGGSLKKLHRLILSSRTYQQASLLRRKPNEIDPENQYLWRYNARRLEWEAIRDSLLFVSGQLDDRTGGRAIIADPDDPTTTCRTIYLQVDRQHIPSFARNFDFPSPDFTSPQRPETTVPQQQLFFLNSPFVTQQAEQLGRQITGLPPNEIARFRELYRRVFAMSPPEDDQQIKRWLQQANRANQGTSIQDKWTWIAQAMLQSNLFVFVE